MQESLGFDCVEEFCDEWYSQIKVVKGTGAISLGLYLILNLQWGVVCLY